MSKLLIEIKSKAQYMSCAEHKEKAEIKILGDKITFNCCCDPFKKKMEKLMKEATEKFVADEMKKTLSKFK